ncbi:aldo/keto reductase [Kribbella jejuensis]|uniref:Aryl-alcohol dehydrogenase-like predicted oxidoreductase n=1 Tax=Kribbella jejuensis TaxID=236068 RepID=A0A542ENK1_9ACTN|nr:aldo/keto reductase [Kribbella jejuensis]TQJ16824.1 aryl-alcohol dehydrogenase-like predicted oxidoreductase [Kribbella jejuensis]
MKRRILGATGMSVSEFALGAMMFGAMGNPDHEDAVRIINRALDAGVNLIDTADVYSAGESEQIVGTAIRTRRDEVVLATKFGMPMGADPNQRGASRRWTVRSVENSLRRLGTDHLDLYQLHRPDHDTDQGETLAALSDLVQAGKILAFGSSMFPAETIVEAQWTAERRGTHRYLTEQCMYSIFTRRAEAAVFPVTQRHGLGVLTFSPLNGGWLSGRTDPAASHRATLRPESYDPAGPTGRVKAATAAKLAALAAEAGLTLPQLATAFVREHPAVTSVIIGPRTQDQLESLLTGAEIRLSADVLDRIDELVPPGTELDPADNYATTPPAIEHAELRRRSGGGLS